MRMDRRLIAAMLAPGAMLAVWLVAGAVLLGVALNAEQRAALAPLAGSHLILAVLWWFVAAGLAAWLVHRLHATHVAAAARLADATATLTGAPDAPDLVARGSRTMQALTNAINELAGQRRELQHDMAAQVTAASARVAEQRDQLAALMAELEQSVVVCNREGRILLYNARARRLFQRLSPAPHGGGSSVIGLDRSIHALFDAAVIAHGIETIERRIAGGGQSGAASAHFVSATQAGHLLNVDMTPVRPAGRDNADITGFVFLIRDITSAYAADSRRDRQLLDLTEASRASFASMQAALDMLDYPDLSPQDRDRFQGIVRDEVGAMSARLADLSDATARDLATRWPLQEMAGADLLAAAARRIGDDTGLEVDADPGAAPIWLRVDSFALLQALGFLASRLADAMDRPVLTLRLAPAGGRAQLDLVWEGEALPDALGDWQSVAMQIGAERSPLSVRDVVARHDGEVWFGRDPDAGAAFFRFLLPLADGAPEPALTPFEHRPEFYDFDLFARSRGSRALDDRPLEEIAYTVFDTETTGLEPNAGDEILQIGATRIVNGKLLRGECFDQLVDPGRGIPEVGIPIHGIHSEMVRGKPSITQVLPGLHGFAADTVLVGHNVAFDMRFLALKEAASGIRFDQPVLDTLLLSSVVHPSEAQHGLDTIAARLGVSVSGRHTALGDAMATAEVFLKLLPLLRQRGILTLGDARAASERSFYARLRY